MAYQIRETYYTLQGEGAQWGRPAVFCRFAGCNLWSGREADRAAASCQFCDTDFFGTDGSAGGRYPDAAAPAGRPPRRRRPPPGGVAGRGGGEPLLQLDPPLIEALHGRGFMVAI